MRYPEQAYDDDAGSILDISIIRDEDEQHRIALEHNLQNLSIPLSLSASSQDSDTENERAPRNRIFDNSSSGLEVEHPRHLPRPQDISVFHGQHSSFIDRSQLEQDYHSNHLSYRSIDDDEGITFNGNTMSTAAHHASAVTLSAGLGGRHGRRTYAVEASLSGAEYDPDRPLDNVVNGMVNDFSMLNVDSSRAKGKRRQRNSANHSQITFDPIIVNHDNSAMAGTQRNFITTNPSKQHHQRVSSYPNEKETTPRARSRVRRSTNNDQAHTPSASGSTTNGSKFTRLAKSLAKEIEASQRWIDAPAPEVDERPKHRTSKKKQSSGRRSPLHEIKNKPFSQDIPQPRPGPSRKIRDKSLEYQREVSGAICLPDVTGLTSAIGSPTKKEQEWRNYVGGEEGEKVEARLLSTLTALQTRLNQLESQNLVSRRRVRELELELDACKLEVKRERTRVLEKEEIIVAQQKDFQKRKGTSKAIKPTVDLAKESRYNEVVEEKKALESLIATLRSHLSRLTDELSSQQAQLDELRSLRECDIRDLTSKISEVDNLKLEIERLGDEVEILRGIVEEGLKERRKAKEIIHSRENSFAFEPGAQSNLEELSNSEDEISRDLPNEPSRVDIPSPPPSRPQSRQKIGRDDSGFNFALNRPAHRKQKSKPRFIDEEELERVSADLEERRSLRSASDHSQDESFFRSGSQEARQLNQHESRPTRPKEEEKPRCRIAVNKSPKANRVYAKTPARPVAPKTEAENAEEEVPFPQIRGERLEKLFFSAPEHNERTCRICHRRRRPGASDDELDNTSWLPPRKRFRRSSHENYRDDETVHSDDDIRTKPGKAPFSEDRLPPQTVLVRILRELEDDFTHYKGIYIELADQYKFIDAASNVPKRNVLAEHLKEVIDTLEQKGDQIASLYDLLTLKDKPVEESVVPSRKRNPQSPRHRRQNPLRKYATCI